MSMRVELAAVRLPGISHRVRRTIVSISLGLMGLFSGCATEPTASPGTAVECTGRSGAEDRSGYLARPEVQKFMSEVATRNGYSCADIEQTIGAIEPQVRPLELISKPAETKTPWYRYRKIFLTTGRIEAGAEFWRRNADALARAQSTYQVPAEIIVAIIGVETMYGRNAGNFPVLDTLATLGFDYPPRGEFFRSELEQVILLRHEDPQRFLTARGSYAGAMGKAQFIPSSYRKYAIDFNGDGHRDLFESDEDAIGSVANYFQSFGWIYDAPVVTEAQVYGDAYKDLLGRGLEPIIPEAELRAAGVQTDPSQPGEGFVSLFDLDGENGLMHMVGYHNFYVITRYNRSPMYALAVYQLSKEIKQTYSAEQGVSMTR
jgi:membrane-bound lytic murein transglycosylase B